MSTALWVKASFTGFCLAFVLTGVIFYVAGADSWWQLPVVVALWVPATVFFRHYLPRAPWHREGAHRI